MDLARKGMCTTIKKPCNAWPFLFTYCSWRHWFWIGSTYVLVRQWHTQQPLLAFKRVEDRLCQSKERLHQCGTVLVWQACPHWDMLGSRMFPVCWSWAPPPPFPLTFDFESEYRLKNYWRSLEILKGWASSHIDWHETVKSKWHRQKAIKVRTWAPLSLLNLKSLLHTALLNYSVLQKLEMPAVSHFKGHLELFDQHFK